MDPKTIGILAALGCAASWAMGAVLFKKVGEQLSSPAMTLVKGFISAALLGLALLVAGYTPVGKDDMILLVVSGVLGIAIGDTLFFAALKELAPHTLIMLLTGGQVLTVVLAVIFLGEKPAPLSWGGIALIILGIFVVVRSNLSAEKKSSPLRGIILGALSTVCMSVSILLTKEPLRTTSDLQVTFIRMVAGAVTMLFISLFTGQAKNWWQPFRTRGLLPQFFLSVAVVTFGAFWLQFVAVKRLDVAIASTLTSVEPLFVLPLGLFFLRDKVTLTALAGSVLAVSGIACICFSTAGR
jgi:drug/metabolite transporter (DMT)-like permease